MSVTITETELQTEFARLDAMRGRERNPILTDEQFQLIMYARNGDRPVPWTRIADYWEERGWGRLPISTLNSRWETEKRRRGV